jgi:hypothetical protein
MEGCRENNLYKLSIKADKATTQIGNINLNKFNESKAVHFVAAQGFCVLTNLNLMHGKLGHINFER